MGAGTGEDPSGLNGRCNRAGSEGHTVAPWPDAAEQIEERDRETWLEERDRERRETGHWRTELA